MTTLNERRAKAATNIALIVAVLEEVGPVSTDALVFFAQEKSSVYIHASDIYQAILFDDGEKLVDSDSGPENVVRLRAKPNEAIRTPSPSNYISAYYKLWSVLQSFKNHPELLALPDSWLDKLLEEKK